MQMMTPASPVFDLIRRFQAAGIDNARRTAEELAGFVLDCGPMQTYLHEEPPEADRAALLESLAARVESGEPLQYVIGHVDFMGMRIVCDKRALIPRPETELLVEEILSSGLWTAPADAGRRPAIADIGTGTGCIVLALACRHPEAEYTAVDCSPAALELARGNARAHALEEGICWKTGDLLDGFGPGTLDAVVANLPYIATRDWLALAPAVRDYEPRSALDSGEGGLELIDALIRQARTVLRPGGSLFLEFGYDQGDAVSDGLITAGYAEVRIKRDLAGHDRIGLARNPAD